jgi:putative N6-adenine-specific DNA methylase
VRFTGDWPAVWRANYWLRTANRVLIELASFPAATSEELYRGASAVLAGAQRGADRGRAQGERISRWRADEAHGRAAPSRSPVELGALLTPARTFAVSATASGSQLRDTRWIALKVKDAIADAQRARFGRRSDVDTRRPEVPLRVWLHDDRASLLLDSSREPLDRRGYRRASGSAPLRETLAAAMVLASGWDGAGPVVDPMCGTGTLLIEAAWIALGRAPGALRERWVFESWPGFDAAAFARARRTTPRGSGVADVAGPRFHGRDLSADAVRAARTNLEAAGISELADVTIGDGYAFTPPAEPGLVLTNPAYGERLDATEDDWRRLGDLLKQRYADWRCAVIAGEPTFGRHLGLKPKRRMPVMNGPLDARILVFDLYRGSRRKPSD